MSADDTGNMSAGGAEDSDRPAKLWRGWRDFFSRTGTRMGIGFGVALSVAGHLRDVLHG